MPTSDRPDWTIHYNIVGHDGWIGTGWEFFYSQTLAEVRYGILSKHPEYCPTLRPYHHTDFKHLGAVHRDMGMCPPRKRTDAEVIEGHGLLIKEGDDVWIGGQPEQQPSKVEDKIINRTPGGAVADPWPDRSNPEARAREIGGLAGPSRYVIPEEDK